MSDLPIPAPMRNPIPDNLPPDDPLARAARIIAIKFRLDPSLATTVVILAGIAGAGAQR